MFWSRHLFIFEFFFDHNVGQKVGATKFQRSMRRFIDSIENTVQKSFHIQRLWQFVFFESRASNPVFYVLYYYLECLLILFLGDLFRGPDGWM